MLPLLNYSMAHLQKLAEIDDRKISFRIKSTRDIVIGRKQTIDYTFTGAKGNRIRDLFLLGKLHLKGLVIDGRCPTIFAQNVFIAGELQLENIELKASQINRFEDTRSFFKSVKLALGLKRWQKIKGDKTPLVVSKEPSTSLKILELGANCIPHILEEQLDIRGILYHNRRIQLFTPQRKVKDREEALYEALYRPRINEAMEAHKLNDLIQEFNDEISLPSLLLEN